MHPRACFPSRRLGDQYETWLANRGEYTEYFGEHIAAGTDHTAFYDSCECPHVGMSSPAMAATRSCRPGYYAPPGYTFQVLEDTDTVEFSPAGPYKKHMEGVAARMAATSHRP